MITLRSSLVAVALVTVSLGGCLDAGRSQALPSPSELPPDVPALADGRPLHEVGVARAKSNAKHLVGTGTLKPFEEAQVGAKATGILSSVKVNEGDQVEQGQLLFTLDADRAYIGIQQARAGLEAAEVGLNAAELDYQRTKGLYENDSVPPDTYDQAETRYDGAKVQVKQAEAALAMAQRNAADMAVRSPIDGVVTAKLKSVGETVTLAPPTVVLAIENVNPLEIHARLPERALSYLGAGDPIHVYIPAVDVKRQVKIERINPSVDARTRTIEVIAYLDNKDHALKSGMLAEVRYDVATQGNQPAPEAKSKQAAKANR